MAYYLHDDVLDNGLTELDGATAILICSALPTGFADAATKELGLKTSPVVSSGEDYFGPDGRQAAIGSVTDGDVDTTGTATHWALIDATRLLASQTLNAPVAVTAGHKWTLTSFVVALPTNPSA